MAKYMLIFDDGEIKQVDDLKSGDAESVSSGYLEVIRYENDRYERMDVEDDGEVLTHSWIEV